MATPPSLGAQDGGGAPRSPIRGGARTRPDTPVLNRLKVTELRALLEGYGESTAGLKSALVERLRLQSTSRDAVDARPASPHDSPARQWRADGQHREKAEEAPAAAELLRTLEARRRQVGAAVETEDNAVEWLKPEYGKALLMGPRDLRQKWRSGTIEGVLTWESPLKACPHARGERTRVGASSEGVCGRTSCIQQRNAGERTAMSVAYN